MALFDDVDPFGRPPKAPVVHEIGQLLDTLSASELTERIALLEAEIARIGDSAPRLDRLESLAAGVSAARSAVPK